MMRMKILGFFLVGFLAGSLLVALPVLGEGFVENIKEFEDNVIFEKEYLNLPTWKKSYTKNLGDCLGEVSATAYFSLGRVYIRLPTKIKAKYDTYIEPFTTNEIQMAVDPYDGEGLEFEFVFGLNVSAEYDPYGPEWLTGKIGVGDFDTGINMEGDWTPPIDGSSAVTTSESFTLASIGLRKLLSLDIGIETRLRITGHRVEGNYYEDDPYTTAHDLGTSGVALTSSTFSPQFKIEDTDLYTSLDGYVDFGVEDLEYKVGYTLEVAPTIGFSFAGVSWTWTIPLWVPIDLTTDYIPVNTDDSDDTVYQMSRTLIPGVGFDARGNGLPIFSVGPSQPLFAAPGSNFQVNIPIEHTVVNPPVGYTVPDTDLNIYREDGTLAKSLAVTEVDFAFGEISTTLTMPEMPEAGDQYSGFQFALMTPDLSPWYGSVVGVPPSTNATVAVAWSLADLEVARETLKVSTPSFVALNIGYFHSTVVPINVTVTNDGGIPSAPSTVNLWLYVGMPSVPAHGNIALVIAQSTLISTQPLSALPPDGNQTFVFLYPIPPSQENKTLTFIVQVDQLQSVPEICEENNVAFTTVEVRNTTDGTRWVYTLTNSSFRYLHLTYGTPTPLAVSDLASDAAMNELAYTDLETFINTMELIAQTEMVVDDELVGIVPDELLNQYDASVAQLDLAINEAKVDGIYTHLELLEVMDLQMEVVDVTDRMWTGSLIGQVVNSFTGEALSGANLSVEGSTSTPSVSTQTDEQGRFSIPLLFQGNYILNTSKFGYENMSQPVAVNPAATTNVTISLVSITGLLTVNVTDEETDEPINAATITITKDAFVRTGVTANGSASFSQLLPGEYNITVLKENYVPAETIATVYSQTSTPVELALSPLQIHDVTVVSISELQDTVAENETINITVRVGNEGMWTETFNVALYANATTVAGQPTTLAKGNFTTITLTWNTTNFAHGSYTISAVADTVPGETDTVDNVYVNGQILVTFAGDIDGDGDVDRYDFGFFAGAYGTGEGDPNYLSEADLDGDGFIDRYDFAKFALNYGKSI